MNLIIDIGNTRAKLVIFDGEEPVAQVVTSNETLEGLPRLLSQYQPQRGIVASTIPFNDMLLMLLESLPCPIMQLAPSTPVPICNHYATPQTLGPDRLAAAVGAHTLMPDHDLLVIDAGTCITYEFVDHEGNYWGGNIAPGMNMRFEAMHQMTARLPLVSPRGESPQVGNSTETAMRSGVLRGMQYEIEGYIRHFRQQYPSLRVLLTGGDELEIEDSLKDVILTDKYIVPRGLNTILNYNK